MYFGFGRTSVAALLLAALAASPSRAGLIIDQQNTTGGVNGTVTPADQPIGQSFTPTLGSIGFATADIATSAASTAEVKVFSGAGFGGTLLGTSDVVSLPIGSTYPAQSTEFDFATPIALTPSNVYTLQFLLVTGTGNTEYFNGSASNPYSGGQAYLSGSAVSNADAVFSEGVLTAVPEPSSLAMMGLGGIAGLGFARARRRRLA